MGALFIYNNRFLILFLLCLISRLATSIFYIEDIDSLRFAYSIIDEYSIIKLQPHFPGYPIFCFLANILYYFIGNLGFVFSLIGGIATFLIIYFSLLLLKFEFQSKEGLFLSFIIFFNPMIWLMGNRYMPDLLGLSILIIIFYFLCQKNKNEIIISFFLIGILSGIRISYIPFLLFISSIVFFNSKNKILLLSSFLFGTIIWLIPLIYITGIDNLYMLGLKHLNGHFTDYGGTMITEYDWKLRIQYFFHTIWSDGFGGYWIGRSIFTIILSILLLPLIVMLIKNIKTIVNDHSIIRKLLYSALIYIIWILPFQNIIYKSRHIMPLILVLIILFSAIYKIYLLKFHSFTKMYTPILISIMAYICININIQHKIPTAINSVGSYLLQKNKPMQIYTIPLITYYLKSQNLNAKYINIDNDSHIIHLDSTKINNNIIIIGDFINKFANYNFSLDTTFYHNPYINRMWSSINIYSNREF